MKGSVEIKQTNELNNIKKINEFIHFFEINEMVESTGYTNVSFSGSLYNVDGSKNDPKIDGNWKKFIIENNPDINNNSPCYVTNSSGTGCAPVISTLNDFSVGGHMTPNANGEVVKGGKCYLMPLCSWHNNKARDGVEFVHTEISMIELTGYMESDILATFLLRLPSNKPFAVLYYDNGDWHNKNLDIDELSAF